MMSFIGLFNNNGTALNNYTQKIIQSAQFEFSISACDNVDLIFPTFWSDSPSNSPLISGTTTCRETAQSIMCTQNNQKFTRSSLVIGSNLIIRCNNVKGPHSKKYAGNFNIQFAEQSCDNIQISNFQPYGRVLFSSNSTTGLFLNSDKLQMILEKIVLPISFITNSQVQILIQLRLIEIQNILLVQQSSML